MANSAICLIAAIIWKLNLCFGPLEDPLQVENLPLHKLKKQIYRRTHVLPSVWLRHDALSEPNSYDVAVAKRFKEAVKLYRWKTPSTNLRRASPVMRDMRRWLTHDLVGIDYLHCSTSFTAAFHQFRKLLSTKKTVSDGTHCVMTSLLFLNDVGYDVNKQHDWWFVQLLSCCVFCNSHGGAL